LDLGLAGLFGQVGLQDVQLRLLLLHQLRPAGLPELEDRVLALLDQALEDAHGLGVVERALLVDLAVLQRGLGHAQRAGARGIPALHRRRQVLADALGHGHGKSIHRPHARPGATRARAPQSRYPCAVRALPALIVLLAASAPGSPTLGRLADAAAAEVARAAAGRPVELSASEDRTGAPTLAADLDALVRARLQARLTLSTAGPRVRVVSVLAQVGP